MTNEGLYRAFSQKKEFSFFQIYRWKNGWTIKGLIPESKNFAILYMLKGNSPKYLGHIMMTMMNNDSVE
jgi:hypothetical protein